MKQKAERGGPVLQGLRVLVVDDEFLIAVTIEETLKDAGAEIVSAATLAAALKAASDEPLSAALLDFRLGRDTSEEVADKLAEWAIPFAFYSGQSIPGSVQTRHPDAQILVKPVAPEAFVKAIIRIARPQPA